LGWRSCLELAFPITGGGGARAAGAESAELQGLFCCREMGRRLPGAPPRAASPRAEGRAGSTAAGALAEERDGVAAEPPVQWGTPCVCLGKMGA